MFKDRWLFAAFLVSFACFVSSLNHVAFIDVNNREASGLELLLSGWIGALNFDSAGFVWFANPLLVASWCYMAKNKIYAALFLALAACGTTLLFLLVDEVALNEGGVPIDLVSIEIGYWLWLTGQVILMGALAIRNISALIKYLLTK